MLDATALTSIADRLDFVDVILVNNLIKASVKVVEQINDLHWCALAAYFSEAHNIAVTKPKLLRSHRNHGQGE